MDRFVYRRLRLPRGPAARAEALNRLKSSNPAGVRRLALFTAQLGWEAAEAALLARLEAEGPTGSPDLDGIETLSVATMTPTLRPEPQADLALTPGGVWVHRQFVVTSGDVEAFVSLSGEAWPDFEARFEASIFGLFLIDAAPSAEERSLLLITRYGDHGVWEASRDPTTEAMRTFQKRAALTRRTWAASTLMTPLGRRSSP